MTAPEGTPAPRPAPRPPPSPLKRVYLVLASPRLAISLLVAVLACCLVGVTALTAERAWALIFTTLWFNGLLVLLAISSGLTFLVRMWGRRLTLVSAGMILFHVSFLTMLFGVVFNGLFHFKGVMRLTEGETLLNASPESYDTVELGRFFDFAKLRGETTLVKMHTGYKVDGKDKRAAYEIEVGEGARKSKDIIYITQNLTHDGVRFLVSKEGHSVGVALQDRQGQDLYAAMVPLQSLPRQEGGYLYVTGSSTQPSAFPFPPPPDEMAFWLELSYQPKVGAEREGEVTFNVGLPSKDGPPNDWKTGTVPVGGKFDAGSHVLEAREVRYWVGMTVRRDPGLTVILGSLWAGLAGMTMTFGGRIWQDSKRGSAR